LYSWPYITGLMKSRTMKWMGHVACVGKVRNAYKMLPAKSEEKRRRGRPRRRWKNNIKPGFKEVWAGSVWLRLEPSGLFL